MSMTAEGFLGRTALVTGGRGGIGFAFARALAERGCRVVITSRDPRSTEVAERLAAIAAVTAERVAPPAAIAWDMDEDATKAATAATAALDAAGIHVDVLVHAAHVFAPHQLILATKPEGLARSLERNVVAPFALLRRLTRSMARARFGRVLLVGSLVAEAGGAGQSIYITEKAALEGMARAFAAEMGSRNVLVNVVAPGIVDTAHVRAAVRPEVIRAFEQRSVAGRLPTPDEVALAAMGLLDGRQAFVTGQVLRVAGGADALALSPESAPGSGGG